MNIRIMIELLMLILQVILFVMNFIRCACKAPHGGRPPAVRVPFKILSKSFQNTEFVCYVASTHKGCIC